MLKPITSPVELTLTSSLTSYPPTRRENVEDVLHGTIVPDPYRWLEDLKSGEVQRWVGAQESFANENLAKLPGREALKKRFTEIYYQESHGVPKNVAGRLFYAKRRADQEQDTIYYRDAGSAERVLLDPAVISPDQKTSIGGWYPSPDGKKLAYVLKPKNADESILHVLDIATGTTSSVDVIAGVNYSEPAWLPDASGFYYTLLPVIDGVDPKDRPGFAEIRFHKLGTDAATDPVVFPHTGDPKSFLSAQVTSDGRFLLVGRRFGWQWDEVFLLDRQNPEAVFRPFITGRNGLSEVFGHDGYLYIRTNTQSPNWRLDRIAYAELPNGKRETVLAERKSSVLEKTGIAGGQLVAQYLDNVRSRVEILAPDGQLIRTETLPGPGVVRDMSANPNSDEMHYIFESLLTPPRIIKSSVSTGRTETVFTKNVPGVDFSRYDLEQKFYTSKDGTRVPMFIVSRKGAPRDGSSPTILYGYGGFNVNLTPDWRPQIIPWLESGGTYAIANLRGGGEFGEDWHRAGMLHNKQNVFDDMIAGAEFLVSEGYTTPARLAASGGSNGGLLMGAMLTQRPDLFRAIICGAPLLDMVRYTEFGRGKTWVSEYGDPQIEADFATLYAYSPYHRVRQGTAYPAVLFTSPFDDDRVDPLHARKMAAALQFASSSARPVWLRIARDAGHTGGASLKSTVAQLADSYAFLMKELGE